MVGNRCVILLAPQTSAVNGDARRDYSVRVYDRADHNEIRCTRYIVGKQLLGGLSNQLSA
jgi:hypothetical protein